MVVFQNLKDPNQVRYFMFINMYNFDSTTCPEMVFNFLCTCLQIQIIMSLAKIENMKTTTRKNQIM